MHEVKTLQTDLDKLAAWEGKWKMVIRPEKCNVITISQKHSPIKYQNILQGHAL